jgi:hypothetical protein
MRYLPCDLLPGGRTDSGDGCYASRGVVLSTPVGQMLELIQDGYNGFICRNLDEFVRHLEELANDPAQLITMRRNALLSIQQTRADDDDDYQLELRSPEILLFFY